VGLSRIAIPSSSFSYLLFDQAKAVLCLPRIYSAVHTISVFSPSMEAERESSLFGQSSARGDHGGSAGKQECNNDIKPLMIVPEHPLRVEDNVTDIDTEVDEDVGVKGPDHSKSRPRRSDHSRHTETEPLTTELDFFLDHPLLYCQDPRFSNEASFQNIPDAHWSAPSVDLQQVQWSRLERLSIHQTLGLVQLLYHAAISTRKEYRRLEDDLHKAMAKHMALRAELRAEKSSNRKRSADQTKKYKICKDYCSQRLARHVPSCTICCEDQIDTALECGHVFCGKCLGKWKESWCPSCREPKGSSRRLYFP